MNKVKKFLKFFIYKYRLNRGIKKFKSTGKTSNKAYTAMRQMFVLTKGASNDKLSMKISREKGIYDHIPNSGVLSSLSKEKFNEAVKSLEDDGYFVFDLLLKKEKVDEIISFARQEPVSYLNVDSNKIQYSQEKKIFDPLNPLSPRYQFDNEIIIKNPAIQSLIFDQSLLAFAQSYLKVKPILDLVALWWSIPYNGKGLSQAAQMYHFDLDRIKFLKFFFYITDVDSETGPHCYVQGSHKILPDTLARDGRFSDAEIEHAYGKERMLEICGKQGTILAVDTRGFHKGKELTKGQRLLFQIEFANSMFGQTYPSLPIKFTNNQNEEVFKKYPYSYQQLFK